MSVRIAYLGWGIWLANVLCLSWNRLSLLSVWVKARHL